MSVLRARARARARANVRACLRVCVCVCVRARANATDKAQYCGADRSGPARCCARARMRRNEAGAGCARARVSKEERSRNLCSPGPARRRPRTGPPARAVCLLSAGKADGGPGGGLSGQLLARARGDFARARARLSSERVCHRVRSCGRSFACSRLRASCRRPPVCPSQPTVSDDVAVLLAISRVAVWSI